MRTSQLYIISEGPDGPVKIGRSVNASARVAGLQTGNPRPLILVDMWDMDEETVIEAERMLHDELKDFGMMGEWFCLGEQFMRDYMPDFFGANGYEPL